MALDVRLVNMPFGQLGSPSLALTQLKRVSEEAMGSDLHVTVEYLNHAFGEVIGAEDYQRISLEEPFLQSGFGDWLFRRIAFPNAADNTEAYVRRYGAIIGEALVHDLAPGARLGSDRLRQALLAEIDRRGLDRADVVGFTSTFAQTVPSLALARLLRERNPRQIILMGGANCEGVMGQALAHHTEDLDYIFSGPALISFPEALKGALSQDLSRIAAIDGVIRCRPAPGEAPTRPPALYGRDLSIDVEIPLDYEDFLASFHRFRGQIEPRLFFETSRGCWWGQRAHCTFCGLNGASMAYRAMPASMARKLIIDLMDRYGGEVREFDCVDNIMAKDYVDEVFVDLPTPPGVSIFYETKADLQDADVRALSASGVDRIQPGIESLITSTLKLMRKGTTAFQNIRLLKSCIAHGVTPAWNLLVGFPGEPDDTFELYQKIVPDLWHLIPPSGVFPVRFDRFSPYHSNPADYDLDLVPADFYGYVYPYAEGSLNDIAYYFQNSNIFASYYVPMFDGLEPVSKLISQWHERWLSPGRFKPLLELTLENGCAQILDTRAGDERRVLLSEMAGRAIDHLVEPVEASWVETHYPGALAELRAARLVFEERGRVLSLVLDQRGERVAPRAEDRASQLA